MSSTISAAKPVDLNRQKKADSESDWQPALKKDKKIQAVRGMKAPGGEERERGPCSMWVGAGRGRGEDTASEENIMLRG